MLMNVGGTSTANAATSAIVISAYAGIYTRGVGAASFGSLYSGSATQSLSGASNNSGALTAWQTQGVRAVSVPLNVTNMTPGDYWVGLMFNTAASSVGSTTTSPQVVIGMMGAPILEVYAPYVDNLTGAVVTAAAGSNVWLQGMYSVTSSALPPSLMASAILQGPPPQQAANANIVLRNW
jgi:hypothetical protein